MRPTGGYSTALRGESLRGRSNPIVGEVPERRIGRIATQPDRAWQQNYDAAASLAGPLLWAAR